MTHPRLAELGRSPTTDGLARSDWRDSGSANAIDATRDRDRGHEEAQGSCQRIDESQGGVSGLQGDSVKT